MEENPMCQNDGDRYRNLIAGTEAANKDIGNPDETDETTDALQEVNQRLEVIWRRYLDRMKNGSWGDHLSLQRQASFNVVCTSTLTDTVIFPRNKIFSNTFNIGLLVQSHNTALNYWSVGNNEINSDENLNEGECDRNN